MERLLSSLELPTRPKVTGTAGVHTEVAADSTEGMMCGVQPGNCRTPSVHPSVSVHVRNSSVPPAKGQTGVLNGCRQSLCSPALIWPGPLRPPTTGSPISSPRAWALLRRDAGGPIPKMAVSCWLLSVDTTGLQLLFLQARLSTVPGTLDPVTLPVTEKDGDRQLG